MSSPSQDVKVIAHEQHQQANDQIPELDIEVNQIQLGAHACGNQIEEEEKRPPNCFDLRMKPDILSKSSKHSSHKNSISSGYASSFNSV